MLTSLAELTRPVKVFAAGSWFSLFAVVALSAAAAAQTKPQVVVTQITNFGAIPNGGAIAGGNGAGTSLGVTPNGGIVVDTTYGNDLVLFNGQTGAQTVLGQFLNGNAGYGNPGSVAVDPQGNVFVGFQYGSQIMKFPYVNGQYQQPASTMAFPTTNCTGNDSADCLIASVGQGNISSMVFDAKGDLFYATNDGGNNPNSIWECTAACLYSGSPTPVMLYQEPTSKTPTTTGQLEIGGVGVDPWGNVFFADSAVITSGSNENALANLNELTTSSGAGFGGNTTGYAATVIVLYTLTDSSPGNYDDDLGAVAVDSSGTVYFGMLYDGIFAVPNNGGTIALSGGKPTQMYAVSFQGAKILGVDEKGNLYDVSNNNVVPSGDDVMRIAVGNVSTPTSPVGTAVTVPTSASTPPANTPNGVYAALNDGSSSSATLTIAAAEEGIATTEFAGTEGTCKSLNTGISCPVAFTFTPAAGGTRSAVITLSDGTGSGSAIATGVGQGALANLDPGVTIAYNTGLTSPASIVADAAGDVFVADPGAKSVFEIAHGSTTPVAIGSGFSTPDALAIDANGDLFIADNGVPEIVEIPNTGTTGAFAAGTQETVVTATTAFGGFSGPVLDDPVALAVGPDGALYISDLKDAAVFTYNPANGAAGLTTANTANGLKAPMGVAVDSSGNLYVADSTLNEVFIFQFAGYLTTVTPPSVTQATGVAVDASGSLLVADGLTGNIVRIPYASGKFNTAQAVTVETISPAASSLWMDSMGDIGVASASGKAAYAIQRSAASINLGTVQDGLTNSGTVYLENSGNQAATLGSPVFTAPANTKFAFAPAATNGCTSGGPGPAGSYCLFTATFQPAVGTASGPQAGTATVNIATPAASFTVNLSGTATQSSILAQVITGFNPPTSLQAGQQITLSATGGASGNPVTFSIDPSSACASCASVSGTTLTALAAGAVKVDANQAGGSNNGQQYAAATQIQATITVNNSLVAADVPALLMNQQNWLAALPGGGVFAQDSQAGTSFGVNPQGNILMGTAYGDAVAIYNVQTAAWTKLGSYGKYNNTGGVAVDSAGNLYVGALYSNIIAKIPYNNGAYSAVTDATSGTPPANCTSSSTAECVIAPVAATAGIGGVSAMTFDSAGDLFIGTDDQGNNPWSIWECSAACLSTGSPAPVMLFQEPAGNNSSTTVGQYYTGALATDPWGNLFFTDSLLLDQSSNASKSTSSDLYYLPTSTGAGFGGATTGYAAAPTLLETFADAKPAGYDDELDAVAVASNGTVYYSVQYDGIFAIPNTQAGGPDTAHQYAVSNQGAKDMELDAHGNIFYAAYYSGDGGDTLGEILTTNNLVTPNAQYQGAPVSASANVVDNAFGCGTAATIAFASSNTEFAATAGTACSSIAVSSGNGTLSSPVASASGYSANITFTATQPNSQSATLTLSDTTNGGEGTAKVTGFALTTPQTLTFTAPTSTTSTYAPGETVTVSLKNGGSNNPVAFAVDSSSTGNGTFASTTVTGTSSTAVLTVTQAGSIVIDANEAGGLVSGTYYDAAPQVQLTLTINQATQAIVFPQPNSPVTYASSPNTTVQLSANGGASGNAVAFTVDASSTGAGTISSSTLANGTSTATLTVTGAGSIVVDANQVGTVNYSAAPQVQQTIVVNQAAQSVSFTPLTQPFYYIAAGATLNIQATGGGSDNPIVFAVDPKSTMKGSFSTSKVSGTISTSTLTMPANQTPTSGTIIVDANQPGNTNYMASAQTQMTINVGSPLPTQTITFATPQTQVGGTTLTLIATASSGFPVTYSSSTASVCTVSGSTATFTKVTSASTCTITASQPGDNQYFAAAVPVTVSFTVNPPGQAPAMNLSLSLGSLTIQPGTVGLTQITITSMNNFTGSVSFACSGLATGYSCTFNPNPVMVAAGASATTTLTVTPPATAAVLRHNLKPIFPVTFAIALCFMGFRKRGRLHLLLLLVAIFAGLGMISGCGGSSNSSTTQTTTTNATVTATSGSMSVTAPLTIIVQ